MTNFFQREILNHSNVTFIFIVYFHPHSWFYHASEAKQVIFRVYSIFSYFGIHSIELRIRFDHLFPFRLTKGKQIPIVEYMTLFSRSQRLRDTFVLYKKFNTNKLYYFVSSHDKTRQLRQRRQRPRQQQQQRQKTIGFMSKTTALHVHHAFWYISLTSTARLRRETSQCDVLWRTRTYYDKFSLLYLNMDKALKNSTPGKVAYIWRIERFQIGAIKFERTQIHFFSDVFSDVVIAVA